MGTSQIRLALRVIATIAVLATSTATVAWATNEAARRAIVSDTDAARATLGQTFANIRWTPAGESPEHLQVAIREADLTLLSPSSRLPETIATEGTQHISLRLVAAMLTPQPLDSAITHLAIIRAPSEPAIRSIHTASGPLPAWFLEERNATIAIEVGTSRLRSITIRRGDGDWTATAVDFAPASAYWLPGRIVIDHNGTTVLTVVVTDAAPETPSLAPLPQVDDSPPRIPFPRIPL